MLRLSSCVRLLTMVMRSSPLPIILIQDNDAPQTLLTMNPLAPPCLSLNEYASEAARDKALRKREGGAFAPPRWGFCPPPKNLYHIIFCYTPLSCCRLALLYPFARTALSLSMLHQNYQEMPCAMLLGRYIGWLLGYTALPPPSSPKAHGHPRLRQSTALGIQSSAGNLRRLPFCSRISYSSCKIPDSVPAPA